jgi:mRNA-degrading endonuclease toxin of MazEF toxin-antitoxin module
MRRSVLGVLSNDAIHHFAELAVVVPLTKNTARVSPSHAVIPKGAGGLTFPSKAVTKQIRAIDKRRLLQAARPPAP